MTFKLTVSGLKVGYHHEALAKVDDFSLCSGEALVLLGRNGAGKSTLLRTLAGLIPPVHGTVHHDGNSQNWVAWLSQTESSEFAWTVYEYVELGRIPVGATAREDHEAVMYAMKQTETEQFQKRSILELSGGEMQRVRIARAIAQETPLVAMDEPTAHLDLEHQLQVLELIRDLQSCGKCVIASLHDLNHAAHLGGATMIFHQDQAEYFPDWESVPQNKLEVAVGLPLEVITTENGSKIYVGLSATTDLQSKTRSASV